MSALPPPILPPTPTILLLEGPKETFLLDASATAVAPTISLAPFGVDEETSSASQWPYDGDELEASTGDATGFSPVHALQNNDRAQHLLELGVSITTSGNSRSGDGGGRTPERKEMGRGSTVSDSISSSDSASGAVGGGASKAVTTEREEIDNSTDGEDYINENSSGGDNRGGTWLWKDEV